MSSNTNGVLKQELTRFLVTGILAVGIDFSSYWLLVETMPPDTAKGFSFVLGSIMAFIMNKLWTFGDDTQLGYAAFRFACLYTLTFSANVAVNHLVLAYGMELKLLGFLFATATSTILNFLGMKLWVFRQDSK